MSVLMLLEMPGATTEQYEQVIGRLTDGKSRMESLSDWPADGILAHAAGQGQNGFRVVDVWESEDAFRRFGVTLVPILEELGVDVQPEVYEAYAFVTT